MSTNSVARERYSDLTKREKTTDSIQSILDVEELNNPTSVADGTRAVAWLAYATALIARGTLAHLAAAGYNRDEINVNDVEPIIDMLAVLHTATDAVAMLAAPEKQEAA